jgi:hypothetical protein
LEDGFLVGFGLGEGVQVVEGHHEEDDPFEPAEVFGFAQEAADDRSWKGQQAAGG